MGEEPDKVMRVVLDSNTVISALIFKGRTSALRPLWKSGAIHLLASADMIREYASVLAYTKFHLHEDEIQYLLEEELIPYLNPVSLGSPHLNWRPSDKKDLPFVIAALAGKAEFLISGDHHLLQLVHQYPFTIIAPGAFLDAHAGS